MRHMFEGLSTWIFRIAAISILAFVVQQIIREQSRPSKVDVKDAAYLDTMEEFIRREHACKAGMEAKRREFELRPRPFRGVSRR